MSLVDSDHTTPARGRSNTHYYVKADHSGQLKPAMTIYLHELSGGSRGTCGHFIEGAFRSTQAATVTFAFCKQCQKAVELKRDSEDNA